MGLSVHVVCEGSTDEGKDGEQNQEQIRKGVHPSQDQILPHIGNHPETSQVHAQHQNNGQNRG